MQFRVKQLSLAVGAALTTGMAGHALALDPTQFSTSDTEQIYVSGSSGQDPGLVTAIARLCVAGTMDLYKDGTSQAAYFCSITTSLFPGATKSKVVLYKSSAGGSGNGVNPLLGSGTALSFMSMGTIQSFVGTLCPISSVVPSVSVTGGGIIPTYNIRTCIGTPTSITASNVPFAGLSDMEPPLFSDSTAAGAMNSVTKNALVFGFAVSESLYRALQSIQGLDSTSTTADTTGLQTDTTITRISSLPIRDNETNMPSLSRDVLGSLFNGNITDWSTIRGPGGTHMPASVVVGTVSQAAENTVYIARRAYSSGTQKWTQLYMYNGIFDPSLQTKCYVLASQPLFSSNQAESSLNTTAECTKGGLHGTSADPVSQGSGSGDVRNCLAAHNAGGQWAIGIISTESGYSAGSGWRFIKINGYSPSLANVVSGRYTSWVEQALNLPSYFTTASIVPATSQAFITSLYTSLGETDNIKALNAAQPQVWGSGALLQLPTVVTPVAPSSGGLTQSFVLGSPINYYSKSTGALDNCVPAIAFPGNPFTQNN
jgi:ABC-type phosphate transport system substrate-binding protein